MGGFELERSKSFGLTLRVTPSSLLMSLRRTSFSSPSGHKKRPPEAVFFFGAQRGVGFELERSKSFGLTLRVTPSSLLMSLRRTPLLDRCAHSGVFRFSSSPVLSLALGTRPPLDTKKDRMKRSIFLVPRGGLEPPHLAIPDPKSGVSTNSTT